MKKTVGLLFCAILAAMSLGAYGVDPHMSINDGKIVSRRGVYAVYSTIISDSLKYGVCMLDSAYRPTFTGQSTLWTNAGIKEVTSNSNCYSVLPPVFDKVQPVSQGISAVCYGGKWAFVNTQCELLTDFVFDAAMPPVGGVAKVMAGGKILQLPTDSLGAYLTTDGIEKTREFQVKLGVRLYDESQYDKSIEVANKLIAQFRPHKLENLPWPQFHILLQAQAVANSARNGAMAITIAPAAKAKYADAFNYYRSRQIDDNYSPLAGINSLARLLSEICFEYIAREMPEAAAELKDVKEEFEQSEYKRCIYSYEAIAKDNPTLAPQVCNMLYICLLHLAGDFERYNIEMLRLGMLDFQSENALIRSLYYTLTQQFATAKACIDAILHEKKTTKQERIIAYSLLASIYQYLSMDSLAIDNYKKAIREYGGSQTPSEIILDDLANIIALIDKGGGDAKEYVSRYLPMQCAYDVEIFSSLGILQLSKEWGLSKNRINRLINSLISNKNSKNLDTAFLLSLYVKSLLQERQLDWYNMANESTDRRAQDLFHRYRELRGGYEGVDIYNLTDDYPANLQEMMRLETEIKSILPKPNPTEIYAYYFNDTVNRIKQQLHANSCAIDFVQYKADGFNHLGAWFVDGQHSTPRFFYIANVDDIMADKVDDEEILHTYAYNGNLIWGKLPISDYDDIFFSPSIELMDKGVEYFYYKGKPLILSVNPHRVTSLMNIDYKSERISPDAEVVLYGGLNYGNMYASTERGGVRTGYLSYSKKEVDEIEDLFNGVAPVQKYTKDEGTASTFKNLMNLHPQIIHLATHGYQQEQVRKSNYLESDRFNYYVQNTDLEDEDWLMSSTGLYLSPDQSGADSLNNVLLSREVALCRLQNTALVVLSACNTSEGSQGSGYDFLLGMNYSLQKASVNNIITTLWNVYDNKTYEFMVSFYRKLLSGSIYDSFNSTVKEFIAKYPDQPRVWSPYILIEN